METKDIKGFEGKYAACSDGRIWSYRLNDFMRIQKQKGGYLLVGLFKEGRQHQYLVHRIIAETFIPNPLGLPEINHKNEVKTDNRVENLEYCDRPYNCNYGTRNERVIETRKKNNPNNECYRKTVETRNKKGCSNAEKKVAQYSLDGTFIREFKSTEEAHKATGKTRSQIRRVANGVMSQTGGFIYKWV